MCVTAELLISLFSISVRSKFCACHLLICMRALDFHQFDTRFHCVACRLRRSKAGKNFYICRTKPRRPLLHCSHAIIIITLALTEWHPLEMTCDWYFLPPHFHICIFVSSMTNFQKLLGKRNDLLNAFQMAGRMLPQIPI